MSMGAERVGAHSEADWPGENWESGVSEEQPYFQSVDHDDGLDRPAWWPRVLGSILLLLTVAWVASIALFLYRSPLENDFAAWAGWIATASTPLILIALTWVILGRTPRREAERFTQAVIEMKRESQALETVLAIVSTRIAENRAGMSEESSRLMSLGEEATDRLGQVTHFLARETAELERRAQALDQAAQSARLDIGVLMSDLPKVETQARAAADAMRDAGLGAHEQAAALEGQVAALIARSREADDVVGSSAQKLGAQIARIESSAGAAGERMEQASVQMNAAVDGAMTRASNSIDQTRAGLEAQGQTLLAMVEQSRSAFEGAGTEAAQRINQRLDEVGGRIEALAQRLSEQDVSSQALVERLSSLLGALDEQLSQVESNGNSRSERLAHSLSAIREVTSQLHGELRQSDSLAAELVDRSRQISDAASALAAQMQGEVTSALAQVSSQAELTSAAAQAIIPSIENMQAAAALAAESMTTSEDSLNRQQHALGQLLHFLDQGVRDASEKLAALGTSIGETESSASRLAKQAGPDLIDALVRVREAANQAANHAREAIGAAIPDSVAALVMASREAIARGITEPVQAEIESIGSAAENAVDLARKASERLTRQLLAIGETAATIEARLEEDRAKREEKEAETLTRRVALLIEAINSTSVDLNKVLSNEVADTAWAAYLKGDRGVFTRRAVRLLESGEAREILRQYEREPDFREQVNRYVHDFEAMLRRVLADREGTAMSVTLLSSDMGKLYVALAQAIDRLRS